VQCIYGWSVCGGLRNYFFGSWLVLQGDFALEVFSCSCGKVLVRVIVSDLVVIFREEHERDYR